MLCLPAEAKLDIFKFLNYKQLWAIKQTNFCLHDFVNYFQGELAWEKLYEISIQYLEQYKHPHKLIKSENGILDFTLNEQLEEKFKNGLENPIPVYLPKQDSNKTLVICVTKVFRSPYHILVQLPPIIKSKEDIKIVYYYLNKLFNCRFDHGEINEFVFNQELLQLLFGKAPKRIYIQSCQVNIMEHTMENSLQFVLNNLSSQAFRSSLRLYQDIIEKYKDILFGIITSGGDNFKEVGFAFVNSSVNVVDFMNVAMLYEHIVDYIATSKDCSKIVDVIKLSFRSSKSLQLIENAEKVEIKKLDGGVEYIRYQLANIYYPKQRFSFSARGGTRVGTASVHIRKIKE
uniref:F-box domain-containing protein n=1 Tax=Meloidogyne enterolobii TaxID=390850 RepID=A0A6V7TS69_MELEN|nr:unnamed protein product [Meloidogyne enterolobii]